MCMFETMPYPDYSDYSYLNAMSGLRHKSGNYQFLNRIIDAPEDTKLIIEGAGSTLFSNALPLIALSFLMLIIGVFGFFGLNAIQQSLVTVFSAFCLFAMLGQLKKTLWAICAASQVAYHFGKI